MIRSARTLFLAVFLACAGLLVFGLFLQHVKHLEPCPLCILQRIAFILVGATALVALLHNPKPLGAKVYGGLMVLFALVGGGVAVRQVWLQHQPPNAFAECGPGLDYMLTFPLGEALPMLFKGGGDCAKVTWRFLGFSIAEWSLVWFALFALLGLLLLLRRR